MQYLYIIKCKEYYKIGIAKNLKNRLSQLQIGNPFELEMVWSKELKNTLKIENVLHSELMKSKVRGEWFYFGENVDITLIIKQATLSALSQFDK